VKKFSILLLAAAGLWAMPPRPGLNSPEPIYPPGVEEAGPDKTHGYGQLETVCILMDFPDNHADTIRRCPARFDSMLYSIGVYTGQPYRQGSLKDFYLENSYGNFSVMGGVAGNHWFRSSYNYSRYYDGNYMLSTGGTLARENVQQVDATINFSQFDLNHDGHIDALFMVHAGADGADDGNVNHCWSHAIPSFNYTTNDGVVIDGVTNVPEFAMVTPARETTMCCIAVMCHEMGHLVGLPDLYDYSRVYYGPGYWGLMSYGAWGAGGNTPWSPSHMEAWSKAEAGFVTPIVITRDTYNLHILNVEQNPIVYKVWRAGLNVDTCFYLENRQTKGFDSPLPGPGLLIWHWDPGAGAYYRAVDLEEDSTTHLDHGNGVRPDPHVYHEIMGDTSDPLPGNWHRTVFDNNTKPNSRNRNNVATNVGVRNIRQAGDTIICDVTLGLNAHDVGCSRLIAPAGMKDSGTVVTPACSVFNYGYSTESYPVRMKIGAGYNDTVRVNSLAPGTYRYLTFPIWTALPVGTLAVTCSTELTGDLLLTNDRRTDSVTVQRLPSHDVGCTHVLTPAGALDSGMVVTPACSVHNFGNQTETYPVRMKIGAGYNNTFTVTGHAPLATIYVTFPAWTALPRGNLAVSCSTELTGDMQLTNDKTAGSLTVRVVDAEVLGIIGPTDGSIDSGVTTTPQANIRNNGTASATFNVRFDIGAWTSTKPITLAAGASQPLSFDSWTATRRGTFGTKCTTLLGGDLVPANDFKTGTVTVQVHDVAAEAIVAPTGTIAPGPVTPQGQVRNYGTNREGCDVTFIINASPEYKQTVSLSGGLPFDDTVITFPSWTAVTGSYIAKCSTYLAADQIPANNVTSSPFQVSQVGNYDVGATTIRTPTGSNDSGDVLTPSARVKNFGDFASTFKTFFLIDNGSDPVVYNESLTITNLSVGTESTVAFVVWPKPHPVGNYTARCSTYLAGDGNAANNVKTGSFTIITLPILIGWVSEANVPAGPKNKNVKDGGCLAYSDSSDLSDRSDASYIYALKGNNRCEFYRYNAWTRTWATLESIPAIGATGKKKGVKKGGSLTQAGGKLCATKGNNTLEFWQYNPSYQSYSSYPWTQKADVPAGAKACKEGVGQAAVKLGDTTYVYLLKGSGTTEFYRYNTLTNTWATMTPAPFGASNKPFKNGSCLAVTGDNTTIYALKGSYNEFFAYTCSTNSWQTRHPLPLIGALGKKKKVKDGAGIAYAIGAIYALKGGNTREYWKYDVARDTWKQFEDMPLGTGKNVKGGGALIADNDPRYPNLWALKGNNTLEFYRYIPWGAGGVAAPPPKASELTAAGSNQMANFQLSTFNLKLAATPNPFTNATAISYSLPKPGDVSLKLYDVTGKLVTTLASGYHTAGTSSFIVHRSSLSSGIYVLKLETETLTATSKLIIE
jgi:immune inhibitor A